MKKISLLFATVVMIILFSLTAGAASEGDLTFELNDDGNSYYVADCDGAAQGKLTIPATHNDKAVTRIGDYAFYYCRNLKSITIPDSVTSIGSSAFEDCTGLISITIPDSVTFIGDSAFEWCYRLTSITIPDGVTSISSSAFSGCSWLTSITIPDSVTTIGFSAFYGCSDLTSITIPDSVMWIGSSAFDNTGYYNNASNWENKVLYIDNHLIKAMDSITSYDIRRGTKTIADNAFYNCTGLTSITIPDSVTTIGSSAFYNTGYYNNVSNWENKVLYIDNHLIKAMDSITSYDIRQGTKTIARSAFSNCKSLTSITIPDSVTSIGSSLFRDCTSLTSITIPDSVTSIGSSAFYYCRSLTSITIPDSVTSIGSSAFYNCTSLKSITIPDSVTSIGSSLFRDCKSLTSITIADSVKSIGSSAFSGCRSLTSITIPDSVTSIGSYAFSDCTGLTSITIPDSVTSIRSSAFSGCSGLKSITIPVSLENIHSYAFNDTNLKYVFYGGTEEEKNNITVAVDGNGVFIFDTIWHYQAADHSYGPYTTKDATCTDNGSEERTCSVCDYVETKTIEKLGHTEVIDAAVSPTCTKSGLTQGKHCSVCNEVLVAQQTVAAKRHKLTTLSSVLPTCTKTGLTQGRKCSICGTVTIAQKTVARKAHINKTAVTKATLLTDGKTETKCSVCGTVSKTTTVNKVKSVKLSKTTYSYNGKTQTPSVTVKDSKGNTLKNGTDYTVIYPKKRKSISKYTVTVIFKGNYSGAKNLTFEIVPAKATLSKVTAGSKQLTATWKTSSGVTGYEVQYSTSKKFTKKTTKTVTIKKAKTKKTTIKKLKKGKKYFVRVRAYKTVSGKKIYGAYSSVKNVKVK